MTLEEILAEWENDSQINVNHLDLSSVDASKMHSKYLSLLTRTKLKLKKEELDQKVLFKDKYMYYEGKMTRDDMDKRGWAYDPYDGLDARTSKFKEHFYETDKQLQDSQARITYLEEVIDTLTEILNTLRWRHQTIRNIIDWKKFESGY